VAVERSDLPVLLHDAVHRTKTLTGELRMWRHQARSQRAFGAARSAMMVSGMVHGVRRNDGVDESETLYRVAQGPGGRYRWDEVARSGPRADNTDHGAQGCDGVRAWYVGPEAVRLTRPHGCVVVQRLLDPAWVLSHDLDVVGEATSSGRAVLQVRATARPSRPRSGGPADMAAERDLVVDADRGFLHRDAALVDGEPYDVMELRDVVLDEELDQTIFDPEIPPGMKVLDYTKDQPPPSPWDRKKTWHLRWPIRRF